MKTQKIILGAAAILVTVLWIAGWIIIATPVFKGTATPQWQWLMLVYAFLGGTLETIVLVTAASSN